MESDDSDSDHTDRIVEFVERIEEISDDKQELTLTIFYNKQSIGYLNAIVINVGNVKKGGLIHDKLKCRDKEVEEEILRFYQSLESTLHTNIIFYITDLFLEKDYRGLGIGGDVLDCLPELLRVYHPEINDIYLYPYPLERTNGQVQCVQDVSSDLLNEMRQKLIHFYSKHGLKSTYTDFMHMALSHSA